MIKIKIKFGGETIFDSFKIYLPLHPYQRRNTMLLRFNILNTWLIKTLQRITNAVEIYDKAGCVRSWKHTFEVLQNMIRELMFQIKIVYHDQFNTSNIHVINN